MPMSETIRKQMLIAQIIILADSINESGTSTLHYAAIPTVEELQGLSIDELSSIHRQLRDLARSLGGLKR